MLNYAVSLVPKAIFHFHPHENQFGTILVLQLVNFALQTEIQRGSDMVNNLEPRG